MFRISVCLAAMLLVAGSLHTASGADHGAGSHRGSGTEDVAE